jgi:hypothetical protein
MKRTMDTDKTILDSERTASERVCVNHCGHDLKWVRNGFCWFGSVMTGDPGCGHECFYESGAVPATKPRVQGDERVCAGGVDGSKSCGHYEAAFDKSVGVCRYYRPDETDGLTFCNHACTFSESEPRHEFVGQYGLGNKFCAFPVGLYQCLKPRDADCHVPPSDDYLQNIKLAIEEESQLPDPVSELANELFDYCVSIKWGQGEPMMAQFEVEAIVRKWLDRAERVRQVMRDAISAAKAGQHAAAREVEPVACPFKVGDRVRYKKEIRGLWPEATVTAITERGFRYEYDKPFVLGTRIGSTTEGEAFESAFNWWELAAAPPETVPTTTGSTDVPLPAASEPPLAHEDELPDGVDYDKWYAQSRLSEGNVGVRVGPVTEAMRGAASDSPAQPASCTPRQAETPPERIWIGGARADLAAPPANICPDCHHDRALCIAGICRYIWLNEYNQRHICGHKCATPPLRDNSEDWCRRCGNANVNWFAPNSLWNRSVRKYVQLEGVAEIICPVCFIQIAEEQAGIKPTSWQVAPEGWSATDSRACECHNGQPCDAKCANDHHEGCGKHEAQKL